MEPASSQHSLDDLQSPPTDQPSHDAAGVDLMLIRDALAMTPAERLRALTEMMASIARLGRIT